MANKSSLKILFCSNYINQHVYSFSKKLSEICDFKFIQTMPMPIDAIEKGYIDYSTEVFVIKTYEHDDAYVISIINDADLVIYGSFRNELLAKRKKENKLTIPYSERIFKENKPSFIFKNPLRMWKRIAKSLLSKKQLLCFSAYSPVDYFLTGYGHKYLKFGYFPQCSYIDENHFKINDKITFIWVGRFIEWKHPEVFIKLLKHLKDSKVIFSANIVGLGEMEQYLRELIDSYGLNSYINFFGSLPNEQVCNLYKQSDIYIGTSDYNEGWGACLNEAMGNGCLPIAYKGMGGAPFLIKNNVNGFLFRNQNDLYVKTLKIIRNKNKLVEMRRRSYKSVLEEWNGNVAAERLVKYFENFILHKNDKILWNSGPMSKARIKWGFNKSHDY